MSNNSNTISSFGALGFFLAGFISYVLNGFWWAVLHAFCEWFYIVYVIIFRHNEILPAFQAFFSA